MVNICAVACVKDSHNILVMSIKHLILNGISDFYIYDHGSDPALSSFLPPKFDSGSIRFRILRKETQPFFQREMVSVLTDLAREDGFEISVAFDADEFWSSTVEGNSLAQQITIEMPSEIDALRVPVINFAQHIDVDDFHESALFGCQYSVVPYVDSPRHPREQVNGGMPFIAMPFPSKVIARLSRDIKFTEGQHDITKDEGQGQLLDAIGIMVRHLPILSRNHVKLKREHGRRRISGGFSADIGWQAQILAHNTDEELDAYWKNNSWHFSTDQRAIVGSYDRLVLDDGLVQIGHALAREDVRWRHDHGLNVEMPMIFNEIRSNQLERMIEHLVDECGKGERIIERITLASDQAIAEREAVNFANDQIRSERDALNFANAQITAERDMLRSELSTMRHSPWHRLRALFHVLRPVEKRLRTFLKRHLGKHRKA